MENDRLEITTPVHPLPENIRKMKRDETVCKFCGVSYLIHNEIKALEDKLKKMEERLKFYEGCEERETRLKEELKKHQTVIGEYEKNMKDKENVISSLTQELSNKEELITTMNCDYTTMEDRLSFSVNDAEKNRLTLESCKNRMSYLNSSQTQQKSLLASLRDDFINQRNQIQQFHSQLQFLFTQLQKQYQTEFSAIEMKLKKSSEEVTKLRKESEKYSEILSENESELLRLRAESRDCGSLRNKCILLEQTVKGLEKDLEKETSKSRMISIECEQYKEQIGHKTKEISDSSIQNRRITTSLEQSISLLQDKLKQKENELNELKMQTTNFKNELERQKQSEKEIHRKANLSLNETEEIKRLLTSTEEELKSIKSERESMILSHQTRIEQLRESFKNKMAEADNWPQKLEDGLKKERSKHLAELALVEQRLKENSASELQIERQKHQELIQKYIKNAKDEELKFQRQLSSIEAGRKTEVTDLQRQLTDCRKHCQNKESELQQEMKNLKLIIRDLEDRLGRLDVGNEEELQSLKLSLKQSQELVHNLQSDQTNKDEELKRLQDEVFLLQETVRRECEERFELTEALSEAREQLLTLKKPSGGYQTPPRVTSSLSTSSSSRRNSGNSLTSLPLPPKPPPAAVGDGTDVSNASGVFKINSVNMADSRRRIPAILTRKK
ncbi:uncharacterized protein LOC141909321 [Tubulanus polymorphus]|uniref:uncharacterized protein LOC141909321 n=1 Tax=Tubulanus polymorphus TaxID=672921 RepID=UPI003DA5D9AA